MKFTYKITFETNGYCVTEDDIIDMLCDQLGLEEYQILSVSQENTYEP